MKIETPKVQHKMFMVRVPDEIYEKIKKISKENKIAMSKVVKHLLSEALKNEK